MSGKFSEQIQQILGSIDIYEVVSEYVPLKKRGKYYFGLCPFHSERTPSFSVTPELQIFHCFGCGIGGNVITFIMEIEQLTFHEAIQFLAEKAGIPLSDLQPVDREKDQERELIRQALAKAAQLYRHLLLHPKHGQMARQYLQKRRIDEATGEEFQFGYAPDYPHLMFDVLMKRQGIPLSILEKAGLIVSKSSPHGKPSLDRFRNRLMVPIHDHRGRIIGFAGRLLGEGEPKYLNSPETLLFQKGTHLFNLHRARSHIRNQQQVILFEGYFDAISAWQNGILNCVATQGTALTPNQVRLLSRFSSNVVLCYDGDSAGLQAAERAAELLKEQNCFVKVAILPHGMDPDEYIRKRGKEAFLDEIIGGAVSWTDFKLQQLKKQFHLQDEQQRIKYITTALSYIADLSYVIEQDHYIRKLAEEFHLSLDSLKEEFRRIKLQKKRQAGDKRQVVWNNEEEQTAKRMLSSSQKMTAVERAEKYLVAYMLYSQEVTEWVKEQMGSDFHSDLYGAIAAYIYRYYEEGNEAGPNRFIEWMRMNDPDLIPQISELSTLEIPRNVDQKAITDLIQRARRAALEEELKNKEQLIKQLEANGQPERAAEISKEIHRLIQKLE
jgi:DNA primase